MQRECCYSPNYGCYHFMPAKHQFIIYGKATDSAIFSLTPLLTNARTPQGLQMNEHIFCQINEISSRRLQILVKDRPTSTPTVTIGKVEQELNRVH